MELIQTTIKVGLDRPVNVLHITDTHLPLCEKDDAARFVEAAAPIRSCPLWTSSLPTPMRTATCSCIQAT